jgi:hypothetical protein
MPCGSPRGRHPTIGRTLGLDAKRPDSGAIAPKQAAAPPSVIGGAGVAVSSGPFRLLLVFAQLRDALRYPIVDRLGSSRLNRFLAECQSSVAGAYRG